MYYSPQQRKACFQLKSTYKPPNKHNKTIAMCTLCVVIVSAKAAGDTRSCALIEGATRNSARNRALVRGSQLAPLGTSPFPAKHSLFSSRVQQSRACLRSSLVWLLVSCRIGQSSCTHCGQCEVTQHTGKQIIV